MIDVCIQLPQRLRDIASRIEANVPSHRNPEAFHAEKSEIADDIRRIARILDRK